MKLKPSVLAHHLSARYPGLQELGDYESQEFIERIHFLTEAETLPNIVYLTDWATLKERDRLPSNLICVGDVDAARQRLEHEGVQALLVDADVLQVYQAVCDIFFLYARFEREIHEAIIREETLDEILDIVSRVFDNPVFVFDAALRVLGSSVYTGHPTDYWQETLESGVSSQRVMTVMQETGLVNRLNTTTKAMFINQPPVEPFYSANFMNNGQRMASISVVGLNKLDERLLPVLDNIVDLLTIVVYHTGSAYYLQSSNLLKMILDMLGGIMLDRQVLQHNLSVIHWDLYDEYQLAKIQLSLTETKGGTSRYMQELLKRLFPDSIIVDLKDVLLLILHRTGHKEIDTLMDGEFRSMLEKRGCKAGMSMRYYDFSLLPSAYSLAGVALEKGDVLDHAGSLYQYENCVEAHLIDLCATSIDVLSLCHPEAMRLYQHDLANSSDFLDSLYVYIMEEKHLAAAAKKLNIHRNTLVYRLSRIQDICGIDLENGRTRMHIIWSYQILRHISPAPRG